jgi:hypothetical protein
MGVTIRKKFGLGGSQEPVTSPKGGRPREVIDLEQLKRLAMLHCTQREIAAYFGIDRVTLTRRLQEKAYRDAYNHGISLGNINLRRMQYAAAQRGSNAMLIWLGKQMLGQKNRVEHVQAEEVEGTDETRAVLLDFTPAMAEQFEAIDGEFEELTDEAAAEAEQSRP